jgi:hypothetical protein
VRRTVALSILLAACAVLFSGGGASASRGGLSGVLRVRDYAVPVGETRVVAGDLRVVAAREIVIAGTLLVATGARIELHAGDRLAVTASGRIVAAGTRSLLAAAANPKKKVVGLNDEYIGGRIVEIDGLIQAGAGRSVKIASADAGTVEVNGAILVANGRASEMSADPGEDGGSITIGGFFGRNARTVVSRRSTLRAGDGGRGFSDIRGMITGKGVNPCQDGGGSGLDRLTRRYAGSDGGKGGSIRLAADTLSVGTDELRVGDGGHGGDAGRSGVASSDGIGGRGGTDIYGLSGAGGEGGSIVVDAKVFLGPGGLHAGAGGDAGGVIVAAGNGAPNCDGGRTTAALGRPGKAGADRGLNALPPAREAKPGEIMLYDGGRGGHAADQNHDAGDGGRVTIELPTAKRRPGVKIAYLAGEIELVGYASGGFGFVGCDTSLSRGTDGGAGGVLTVPAVRYSAIGSFFGGDGGDGDPAGDGGRAGTATHPPTAGRTSFRRGADGHGCNEIVGSGTIARGGCDDPHCVTAIVTFTKPFRSFRIQLPKGYGEANIGVPTIAGRVAGTCTLVPIGTTVTTRCELNATASAGTRVSFDFQGIVLGSDAVLPAGVGGDLYWLPSSAQGSAGMTAAGPFKLTGP